MLSSEKWYEVLLKLAQCRGAEGEENPPNPTPKEEEDDEDDDEDEASSGGEDPKPNVDGLKSALEKERRDRKKFERELKELRKLKESIDSKDATEAQKAQKAQQAAEEKASRLASRLRRQAVDMAITRAASNLKFRDVSDALKQVDRDEESWVTQDDDDPSEIEVDEKAVEKAVKQLADKKQYLLDAEGGQEPSGSKFGGGKNNNNEMDDVTLRGKYSGLRPPATSST